jgi:nucleotide-binding universal stress UspA family protein
MLPSRIVVATDGSPAANAAVAFAADLAKSTKATDVVVVSVAHQHRIMIDRGGGAVAEPDDKEVALRRQLVDNAAGRIRELIGEDGARVETKVLKALSPADAIIQEAHAGGGMSHIVMGDRGHGGFESLLLGSVSHHVIQGAHCPVTVIRE